MTIKDLRLELPKNAKLFEDTEKCLYYAVHYNHVVLVVNYNQEILDLYCASATSKDVITRAARHLDIDIDIRAEYKRLHKMEFKNYTDIYDWSYKMDGYNSPKVYLKQDWQERQEALEKYDHTKDPMLRQGVFYN